MKIFEESEEFQIQLLESIISPKIPCSGSLIRTRSAPTKIKVLYHLFQLNKNVELGKWKCIFQGKDKISSHSHVSKKHISEFINSSDFSLFGEVQHRKGKTNMYRLQKWIVDIFHFLEKKGMMKFFRTNFQKWKRVFNDRLHKWLLPLLRKGNSLYQILMNKLSTKKTLKGDDPKTLKGDAIKYSSSSYKSLQGSRSNNEQPTSQVMKELCEIDWLLKNRFHLQDGDIYLLSKSFSLNHHRRAIRLGNLWLKRGMDVHSPVRMYQTCLNRTKHV